MLTFGLGFGSQREFRQWLAPERPAVEGAAPTEAFCKCSKGPDGLELDPDIVSGDTSLHGSHAAPTVELDVPPVLVLDEYFGYAQGDGPHMSNAHAGGRVAPSFMREKARTTPFDWPALSAALNTSNAGAGGALKPANSTKRGSSTSEGGVAKRKRGGGETS